MAQRTKTGLTSLPIWRDANQFLLAIEKVVKLFPKYHKYTLGTELRQNALKVCNLIHQAWQERSKQCDCLQQLKYCIDEIKIQLHLAKKLQALPREVLIKSLEILRDFKGVDSRRALQAMASHCQKAQQRSYPFKAPPEGG